MAQQSGLVFQHTAARRRLEIMVVIGKVIVMVSTHSRPKAADFATWPLSSIVSVSTHSRPKAADKSMVIVVKKGKVSTHSRPKAAAMCNSQYRHGGKVSTHSRPKAAGADGDVVAADTRFNTQPPEGGCFDDNGGCAGLVVSTHSRPKAADHRLILINPIMRVSTHSRPKAAG